jgi:nucleotide-binding universal stress UspA family protein
MKNLLIATDFSDNAKHAAIYGYKLAEQLKANIILCNAFIVPAEVPQAGLVSWPMYEYDELLTDSTKLLHKLKTEMEESAISGSFTPIIKCQNEVGPVMTVISELADQKEACLTIMGTHGSNGLSEFVIGNHSKRMINYTKVPLLLVPLGSKATPVKKIAFATDFKEPKKDLQSIYELIALIAPLNAELLITHIQDEKESAPELKKQIDQFMTEVSNKANYPAIYYRIIQSHKIESGLEWLFEHGHVDILAMVHRQHNFLERIVNASFTQKIAREITIPLLVIPEKD